MSFVLEKMTYGAKYVTLAFTLVISSRVSSGSGRRDSSGVRIGRNFA